MNHKFLSLAFLMVTMLTACVDDPEDEDTMKVKVGDIIPSFVLSDSTGQDIPSSSLIGRVFILNFIDTSCPDCRQELQVLQRIYDKYQEDVPILNIPRSQTKEELQAYWQETGLSIPYYIPHDSNLYYQFATKTIPRTYIVDVQGKVYAAFDDKPIADFDTLDHILQVLLGE